MSDDGFSASELRRRYALGGQAADNELSAAQLRARHGIKANSKGLCVPCMQSPLFAVLFFFRRFLTIP